MNICCIKVDLIFTGPPPCDDNPCNDHGTCENTDGGYTCTCTQAWTGDNCDTGEHGAVTIIIVILVYINQYYGCNVSL